MNSLPPADLPAPPPDGDANAAPAPVDPYEALDDLMVVIEGLCPVWPDKDIPRVTVGFLL